MDVVAQTGEGPLVDGSDVGEVGRFEGRGLSHAENVVLSFGGDSLLYRE